MNYAYELLPKLTHLTLTGIENGELEWSGTERQRDAARAMEQKLSEGIDRWALEEEREAYRERQRRAFWDQIEKRIDERPNDAWYRKAVDAMLDNSTDMDDDSADVFFESKWAN